MWLYNKLKEKIMNVYLGSIVRNLLAGLGGYLVAKGVADQGVVDAFISGNLQMFMALLPWIVAQLLSLLNTKKNEDLKK